MTPIISEVTATFTGLETMLISILLAFITCFGTFLSMGRLFMRRSECSLNHEKADLADQKDKASQAQADKQIKKDVDKLLSSSNLQFMMLREIIVYLDIPPDVKTRILNMKPVKND